MKLQKVYSSGKILNGNLYSRLQDLDKSVFYGCGNEFKENRDWWVIVDRNKIVAYCGSAYAYGGVCLFVRAWVHEPYRGKGIQKRMIKCRVKAAYGCKVIVTYTLRDNYPSMNSLVSCGFRMFEPEYAYAGRQQMYFRMIL